MQAYAREARVAYSAPDGAVGRAAAAGLSGAPAGCAAGDAPGGAGAAAHVGAPYDVAAAESLLTILVFKGGALAAAGHNHLIASHELSGTFYVAAMCCRQPSRCTSRWTR